MVCNCGNVTGLYNFCRRCADSASTACSAAAPEGGGTVIDSSNPDAVASAASSAGGMVNEEIDRELTRLVVTIIERYEAGHRGRIMDFIKADSRVWSHLECLTRFKGQRRV